MQLAGPPPLHPSISDALPEHRGRMPAYLLLIQPLPVRLLLVHTCATVAPVAGGLHKLANQDMKDPKPYPTNS